MNTEDVLKETTEDILKHLGIKVSDIEVSESEKDLYLINIKSENASLLIGHNGEQLKKIGREARIKIEELAGGGVYLDLWVKVKENWRKNESFLREIGYTPEMS